MTSNIEQCVSSEKTYIRALFYYVEENRIEYINKHSINKKINVTPENKFQSTTFAYSKFLFLKVFLQGIESNFPQLQKRQFFCKVSQDKIFCIMETISPEFRNQIMNDIWHLFESSTSENDLFLNVFSSFQKYCGIFQRFKEKYKKRKYQVKITADMYLNELELNHRFTMKLYQNNSIYYFSLNDLSKHIVSSITYHRFIHEWCPLPIKNPYTNIYFKKSELYSIYFKMKQSGFPVHHFIELFFRCDFNIYLFRKKYEDLMNEYHLHRHVWLVEPFLIYDEAIRMLQEYYPGAYMSVGFSVDQIVTPLRPFLFMYYMANYSYSTVKSQYYKEELRVELKKFFETNPDIFKSKRKYGGDNSETTVFEHVCNYKNTLAEPTNFFLNDHVYNENAFNRYIHEGKKYYMSEFLKENIFLSDTENTHTETIEEECELVEEMEIYSESSENKNPYVENEDGEDSDYYEEENEDMYDP